MIVGPPAAGKTTYVQAHRADDDMVIDFDALYSAINDNDATYLAWKALRDYALEVCWDKDVWLIHSIPSMPDLVRYRNAGAQVITIDPGREIVEARCRELRGPNAQRGIDKWYSRQKGRAPSPKARGSRFAAARRMRSSY